MKTYTDLLMLAFVVVYVVDLSGFTDTFLRVCSAIAGRPVKSFRPFTCSLCMVWWTGLAYCLITGTLGWNTAAFTALLSFLSYPLGMACRGIREVILNQINKLF